MTKTKEVAMVLSTERTLALAEELKKVVQAQKLSVKIQGRDFVMCEGWQFAGNKLGIFPVVKEITHIPGINGEIKYSCMVDLVRLETGDTVGRGFALCSNQEPNKRTFQEYAIASMAQTRAIGKAFRNTLAWLMRCSGFEPTPAEEMQDEQKEDNKFGKNIKQAGVIKKRFKTLAGKEGVEIYYGLLNSCGFEHFNDIRTVAEQEKILAELVSAGQDLAKKVKETK